MSDLRIKVVRRAIAKFIFNILLSGMFEGMAVLVVTIGPFSLLVNWTIGILLHCMAAGSFLIFRKRPRGLTGMGYYLPRLCGLLVLFIPVIGLPGAIISVFSARVLLESKGLATHLEGHEYRGDNLMEYVDSQDSANILRQELDILPIVDIIASKDAQLKRGAINLLRRLGTVEAVALLKSCLTDKAPEVRFYAHTALTRLEEERIKELQEAEKESARGGPVHHKALVMAYLKYAHSGLPEQTMQEHYLNEAYDLGTKVVFEMPSDVELTMTLADLAYERGEYIVAEGFYWNLLSQKKGDMEAYLGLCRIQYRKGDMASLKHVVQEMREAKLEPSEDPEVRQRFDFWSNPHRRMA